MRFTQRQARVDGGLVRFSIQLPPETVARLDAICARENLSRAAVIVRQIHRGLEHELPALTEPA